MNCPTCDHTLQRLDVSAATLNAMWWCQMCGTLVQARGPGAGNTAAEAPQLVHRCRAFEKSVIHGFLGSVPDNWRDTGINRCVHKPEDRL